MNARNRTLSATFIGLLSFYFSLPAVAITHSISDQEISQKLDAYMQALTTLNRFSGTVVVAKGDTVLLNKGYGFASREFDAPNDSQTYFRICSISKTFTAVAILQLQEKGLLKTDDLLSSYIPDYPRGNEITIHHLLTHTSGISGCNFPVEMVVKPTSLQDIIAFFKTKPLEFNPGADFQYSNAGYYMLSYIIEKASGKKFEAYIKEYIAEPIGINTATLDAIDYAILKNIAVGYSHNEKNNLVHGDYSYVSNFNGAGGLCLTAHDLYFFARALCSGTLLSKDSLKSMFTIYHPKQNYGYGCSMEEIQGHKYILHNGASSSGFRSSLSMFADDNLYIAITSNVFSSWVYDAHDAIAAIMFDQPYDFPKCDPIKVDPSMYNEYVGIYEHPSFSNGYHVEKRDNKLYLPDNIEINPIEKDQFISTNKSETNRAYYFIRNTNGEIDHLIIKGWAPYYEIRCRKIEPKMNK